MSKFSQKQTNGHSVVRSAASGQFASRTNQNAQPVKGQWVSRATVNKFVGMASNIEEVAPEIIPGYKIRG